MYLLDTHVLLWAARTPKKLKLSTHKIISENENVHVSPISLYEIIQKISVGKLDLEDEPDDLIRRSGFQYLPLTAEHAIACRSLPSFHRDPFDRMLLGQAMAERMTLISADRNILQYDRDVKLLAA